MRRTKSSDSRPALAAMATTLLTLVSVDATQAALLAHDPFLIGVDPSLGEYTAGDEDAGTELLGGQDPILGPTAFYDGPWLQAGGDSQVVRDLPSLAFPGFAAGQGGVVQDAVQFDCCSFGRSARALAVPLGVGLRVQTIYESFLVDFGSQGSDDPTQFGKRAHEFWNGGLNGSDLILELFLNHFDGTDDLSLGIYTPSLATVVPLNGGGLSLEALEGTHLVVMKFTFRVDDPDIVAVFLDPAPGQPEPVIPNVQVSVLQSDLVLSHHGAISNFTFSGATHVPGTIDEIRWGDTFEDVTPLPEPKAALPLATGLLALIAARRRRRLAGAPGAARP
jgi:hypothetical protein